MLCQVLPRRILSSRCVPHARHFAKGKRRKRNKKITMQPKKNLQPDPPAADVKGNAAPAIPENLMPKRGAKASFLSGLPQPQTTAVGVVIVGGLGLAYWQSESRFPASPAPAPPADPDPAPAPGLAGGGGDAAKASTDPVNATSNAAPTAATGTETAALQTTQSPAAASAGPAASPGGATGNATTAVAATPPIGVLQDTARNHRTMLLSDKRYLRWATTSKPVYSGK